LNIFDILKDVICNKTGSLSEEPEFSKAFQPFILARYFSMRSDLMKFALFLNSYSTSLSNEQMYKFLLNNIPQSKNYFIKYISKPKKKKDESDIIDDEEDEINS